MATPVKLQRGAFTLKEGILPVAELGKRGSGYTRMQVQDYYERQRNLGLSIRDACRGTEFALNIKDIQVDSSGKTVVYFTESVGEVVNPATVQQLLDKVNPLIDAARRKGIAAQLDQDAARGYTYPWAANKSRQEVEQQLFDVNYPQFHLVVNPRKKYIAIDTKGGSGKFLVDTSTGLIHDIKGYGVPHPRHHGTLSQNLADPKGLALAAGGHYLRYF